jgi:hypothetical protein
MDMNNVIHIDAEKGLTEKICLFVGPEGKYDIR